LTIATEAIVGTARMTFGSFWRKQCGRIG